MITDKKITHVRLQFQGTKKGKRKVEFQSERITKLDGHVLLSPEQVVEYERDAWAIIDNLGYKNATKGSICVNHGYDVTGDGLISMELLPKQRVLVMR